MIKFISVAIYYCSVIYSHAYATKKSACRRAGDIKFVSMAIYKSRGNSTKIAANG